MGIERCVFWKQTHVYRSRQASPSPMPVPPPPPPPPARPGRHGSPGAEKVTGVDASAAVKQARFGPGTPNPQAPRPPAGTAQTRRKGGNGGALSYLPTLPIVEDGLGLGVGGAIVAKAPALWLWVY